MAIGMHARRRPYQGTQRPAPSIIDRQGGFCTSGRRAGQRVTQQHIWLAANLLGLLFESCKGNYPVSAQNHRPNIIRESVSPRTLELVILISAAVLESLW